MKVHVTIYPKVFMSVEDTSWSARPSPMLSRHIHSGEGSARWICCIEGSHISLGDPYSVEETAERKEILYLPDWFCESLGITGGEKLDIEFKRSENLEKATELSFKIIGKIPDDIDIRDLIEEPLSQLGVMAEGQTIPVPVLEDVMILLESCKPDALVFLDGIDITMKLKMEDAISEEDSLEEISTAVKEEASSTASVDFTQILPASYYTNTDDGRFKGIGHRLG